MTKNHDKKPRWLPRRQRQTIFTCYQFNRHTKQSGYLTIKPCAGKPHNKGIFVKIPVGKTTETLLEYPNSLMMRRCFGAFFFNLIGFLHKKYSPVTSCVTQSVTSCHRAVTLWSRSVTLCPITRNGTCNAMCNVHVTLPVTETLQIIFCIFILLYSFLLFP